MKKFGLSILIILLSFLPCIAKSTPEDNTEKPKVFIYHISDDTFAPVENENTVSDEIKNITSDDITADTSTENAVDEVADIENPDDYEIDDMYSDVLYGYASFEEEDTISLEDDVKDFKELHIRTPKKIGAVKFNDLKKTQINNYNEFSKYSNMEYSIKPLSSKNYRSIGGFSAGTMFDQGIDYAELEQSTGIFSRYENKYFAINTAYAKTVNSTNNNYNDNFYFSPELKLNQYFTLKEILSADITRNRKKAEFVVSINPFGKKDSDRLRFNLGTSTTFDDTNAVIKSQFKFSTNFKL